MITKSEYSWIITKKQCNTINGYYYYLITSEVKLRGNLKYILMISKYRIRREIFTPKRVRKREERANRSKAVEREKDKLTVLEKSLSLIFIKNMNFCKVIY